MRAGRPEALSAVADLFRRTKRIHLDEPTRRLLDLLLDHDALLDNAIAHSLTPHLQQLLTRDPSRVARIALAGATVLRRRAAPIQSRHWRAGKDLLAIAATLQRMPGFAKQGMELLEELQAAGAHGVADLLRDADRRLDRAASDRPWRE